MAALKNGDETHRQIILVTVWDAGTARTKGRGGGGQPLSQPEGPGASPSLSGAGGWVRLSW